MKSASKETGVGLIEVMVTVLILSTALMALAALQTRALQYNSSAFMRSQANIIAYDVMERIRILSPPKGAVVQPNNVNDLVAVLPNGSGSVNCDGSRVCTVSITWTEPVATQDKSANEQTTFSYMSRI